MPNKSWILAIAGLLLGGVPAAFSADSDSHYKVRAWSTGDGLPGSSVISTIQTRDGYLWLGTLYGLVRFDGIRFTTFDENNTPGLNSGGILRLFEDSRDELWIITENGGIATIKDGRVINKKRGSGSIERNLGGACEDSTGAVWFYTLNGQLLRCPAGEDAGENITSNYFDHCRAVMAKKSGPIWVGTADGLFTMDPGSCANTTNSIRQRIGSVASVDFLLPSRIEGFWCLAGGHIQRWNSDHPDRDFGPYPWDERLQPITSACEDAAGNLVVSTYGGGIYWFDAEGRFAHITSAEGLTHDFILSLTFDHEGSLWVGTDGGGLDRVKRSLFDVWRGTEGKTVQSVCEDSAGGLWVGFNAGADRAINYWKDGVQQQFAISANIYLRSIFVDHNEKVWAGAWGPDSESEPRLFQLEGGRFRPGPRPANISAIFEDKHTNIWLGTEVGLTSANELKTFSAREGLCSDAVRAIADGPDGDLWIGTTAGLNRLHEGKITALPMDGQQGGEDVSALLMDGDGVLWIGTRGRGLERYYDKKWIRYTTENGLAGNSISYLLEDGQGCLWMGSNAGLMRVTKKALNDFARGAVKYVPCRTYEEPDGLPTGECTFGSQPAALRAHDGKLYFSTTKGLAVLDPARLVPNTNPPPVIIESVLVGQEKSSTQLRSPAPSSITIPAGRERLDIQFTSLNLAAPERTRFKYRLKEHESAWTELDRSGAGDAPTARYSKLPPGDYVFQVTACNEDGVWNETGASLAIMVLPPFWRTAWFLGATGLCLLGMVVAVVHYISTQKLQRQLEGFRQQEALEKERARIARDIHDQLGASLTQVSLLGEMVESDKEFPEEIEAHARQISQTARETAHALDEIVWTVNPSNDTLEGLVTYVCKYAQEYFAVAGLKYRVEAPAHLPEAVISPEVRHNVFLAVKESVTNVVRHAHASAAWIRLRINPGSFTLEIQDDGRGIANMDEKRAQSRNGLRNMSKRMEDIGGKFVIGPAPERGTLVSLTAPIENK